MIEGGRCGLHLLITLPPRYPDATIVEAACRYNMAPQPLSAFALQLQPQDNGLVLGYGNTPVELIAPAVKRLSQLIRTA